MTAVSIVNYGIGNTGSIVNMYRKLGTVAGLASSAEEVMIADRLLLPGIGAFDACVVALERSGMRESILEFAKTGRPLLGICVGMQMLTDGSEEGDLPGLGLVPSFTRRFDPSGGLRVPHMGWNDVRWTQPGHPLARNLDQECRFYFVHSYRVVCESPESVLGLCAYDGDFAAAIHRQNVAGVQFHPEKSHRFGLQLLSNFSTL